MIGIYQFTNNLNNKKYIGQSKTIESRYKRHLAAAKSGAHSALYAAIRKYGIENFSFSVVQEYSFTTILSYVACTDYLRPQAESSAAIDKRSTYRKRRLSNAKERTRFKR